MLGTEATKEVENLGMGWTSLFISIPALVG
jgi:hypothetical protein